MINQLLRRLPKACLVAMMVVVVPQQSTAAELDISNLPLFLVTMKPSIMVMLDNSGSMKNQLYKGDHYTPYSSTEPRRQAIRTIDTTGCLRMIRTTNTMPPFRSMPMPI